MADPAGRRLEFIHGGRPQGALEWSLTGEHNALNALAATAVAEAAGVPAAEAIAALADFGGVKKRMELLGQGYDIAVYDDFAHHHTDLRLFLQGHRGD